MPVYRRFLRNHQLAGYFIAEYFVFDPGVAIASIVTNTIQAVMSVIVSMILYAILRKRLG